MKRLTISTSILLIVSLGLIVVVASTGSGVSGVPQPKPKDPNVVRAKVREFAGLEKTLDDLAKKGESVCSRCHDNPAQRRRPEGMGSRNEGVTRQRMPGRTGSKISAKVNAMHGQTRAELDLIRKLAVEEGAKKTIAAIDSLLLSRQERLEKIAKKSKEQSQNARRMEPQQRRTSGQGRSTRDRRRR